MENVIQAFVHEKFGKIRTLLKDGKPRFVAVDVCNALGLSNTTAALARLDDDEKEIVDLSTFNSNEGNTDATSNGWIKNEVNVVNEPGLYRLIFASRKAEAKIFQRWIYHEVIPAIMKTGMYIFPNAATNPSSTETQEPTTKILPPHLTDPNRSCVYVLEFANGTVKIGRSMHFFQRANEIKNQVHLEIVNSYHTGYLPQKMAASIEKSCHRAFNFCRVQSEIFRANYAEACAAVAEHARTIIQANRSIYEKEWPDSFEVYNQFLTEIPLPPGAKPVYIIVREPSTKTIDVPAKIAAADATKKLPLKNKIEYLLECARIATLEGRKEYFLQRVDALI